MRMEINLLPHKTKIICTVGPGSRSEEVLTGMLAQGMDIARLNFSHGTFEEHRRDIGMLRSMAERVGRPLSILVDLPGPKIRVGVLDREPMELEKGAEVSLTVGGMPGTASSIPVTYEGLPRSVAPGSPIYLNDGFIELRVVDVEADWVRCTVVAGGPLLSGKGINLPGARMYIDALTEQDRELMDFALDEGIDTFGVSFVESADDIVRAKEHALRRGVRIHTVAKIERAEAVENIDAILEVTDAIMVARGDLGVEIPIEDVPVVQKELIRKANLMCRPVITATQMLMSMVDSRRPTRAEATDVANAILDGADGVMLSEETAIGKYPVETVTMMARIAATMERRRKGVRSLTFLRDRLKEDLRSRQITVPDTISLNVADAAYALQVPCILTPTARGTTARRISRFKPESWIIACSEDEGVCNFLNFSYGVRPVKMKTDGNRWYREIIGILAGSGYVHQGDRLILTEGKFSNGEGGTDSMGIITIPHEETDGER